MTNDLLATRANGHTARGRRVRDLFRALIERLGSGLHDAQTEADALEIAELTVACEEIRTELAERTAADAKAQAEPADAKATQAERVKARADADKARANLVNAVTRLQSTKDRARRGLLKGVPPKPAGTLLAKVIEDAKVQTRKSQCKQ
jgi:uncharacterized membrane protein YccC